MSQADRTDQRAEAHSFAGPAVFQDVSTSTLSWKEPLKTAYSSGEGLCLAEYLHVSAALKEVDGFFLSCQPFSWSSLYNPHFSVLLPSSLSDLPFFFSVHVAYFLRDSTLYYVLGQFWKPWKTLPAF